MDVGAAILEIGGGTTDIAIFSGGAVKHSAVLAMGGDSLTGDIVQTLRIGLESAEYLKINEGCCLESEVDPNSPPIIVPSMEGYSPIEVDPKYLSRILEHRVAEIMGHVNQEVIRSGYDGVMHEVVLTGGSSLLKGIANLSRQIFDRPVRKGFPNCQGGLSNMVNDPKFSTAIGLILYGAKNSNMAMSVHRGEKPGPGLWGKVWRRIKSML
jgi:cell division protein FtsA